MHVVVSLDTSFFRSKQAAKYDRLDTALEGQVNRIRPVKPLIASVKLLCELIFFSHFTQKKPIFLLKGSLCTEIIFQSDKYNRKSA